MGDSVQTKDVLRWLRRVLEAHRGVDRPRAMEPLLLAASLPERERWNELISGVFGQEDGVLVDATGLPEYVDCGNIYTDAPLILPAVQAVLDAYNARDPSAELSVTVAGDRLTITGAHPVTSVNAAQGALREVAKAVCARDMRAAELVAFSYAEDALDVDTKAEVWALVMQLPELLSLGQHSTLLAIAGDGQLDFDLHCGGQRSLRYLLGGQGLRERKSWSENTFDLIDLRRHAKEDMPLVVLFLGAGASVAKELPTGDKLRNEALAGLTQRAVDAGNWQMVAADWFRTLSQQGKLSVAEMAAGVESFVENLTLERVIAVEQDLESQNLSTTLQRFRDRHRLVVAKLQRSVGLTADPLAKCLATRQRLVLVTVNFDRVIETRTGDDVKPFVTEGELSGFESYLQGYLVDGGPVPLLKLHGDIEVEETIVANLEQTSAGLSSARSAALQALISRVSVQRQRPWWYVGYSMRDADLDVAWSAPDFADRMNEHWVAPFLDPSIERFINHRRMLRWQQSRKSFTPHNRSVTLTAEDFYGALYDEVISGW